MPSHLFRLSFGEDDSGWQIMYLRRGGGYYFDAGCSQMIVDGRIGLIQFSDIDRFGPEGATMKDGSVKSADLIVLATGYEGQAAAARRILGNVVGECIGPVWGFDAHGSPHLSFVMDEEIEPGGRHRFGGKA